MAPVARADVTADVMLSEQGRGRYVHMQIHRMHPSVGLGGHRRLASRCGRPARRAADFAGQPDLSSTNWIAGGGPTVFNDWVFTEAGKKRFEVYDFKKDDPAYGCIGASWTRIYLNPNVVIQITQGSDFVRLQDQWMDIDCRIPLVDPAAATPKRANIPGHPALGYSAAWYDVDTLVIDTVDMEPGYITTMVERAGMPQSRRMHTVERLRRQGDVLTIQTTHVDAANYRTPVETVIRYRRRIGS